MPRSASVDPFWVEKWQMVMTRSVPPAVKNLAGDMALAGSHRMSAVGHEDPFPRPTLNGRSRVS
jgi:hypothetical protein